MVPDRIELIDPTAFSFCESVTRITFPSCSVLREVSGFPPCAITDLVIPATVERIGTVAFAFLDERQSDNSLQFERN
jgi:hypothetical protein